MIAFFSETVGDKTARESEVFTSICGCNTTANNSLGLSIFITSNGLYPRTNVNPPSRQGATLSACSLPLATASPFMAKSTNSCLVNGFPKSSLMPKTAPAALAEELPMPLPAFIFLWISISKPKSDCMAFNNAKAATPATFFSVSKGKSAPVILVILMPFSATFRIIISSPIPSRHNPITSNPQLRLAIVAGQNILISFIFTVGELLSR